MTVTELLENILRVYAGATAEALKAIRGAYFARLREHEGAPLQTAWDAVVARFKATVRQPFPIVADFEAELPANRASLPGGAKRLDLQGRNERLRHLMARWRADQGHEARDVPEVFRAMEHIAGLQASLRSWAERPDRIWLDEADLALARKRAISQQRRLEFGDIPPKVEAVFLDQVREIGERWGIRLAAADWTQATTERREAA